MSRTSARLASLLTVMLLVACSETGQPANTSFTGVEDLRSNQPVTQTFVPTANGLSLVRVWIGTYGVPGPAGTLTATLSDESGVLREVELHGAGLRDLQAQAIVFEPVPDSAGRTFELALTWDGVNRTAVLVNENDAYPDGEASTGGDLRFEVGTSDRVAAVAAVVGDGSTHVRDAIVRDPLFWGLWLSGLVAFVWLAARVRRRGDAEHREPAEP